MAFKLRPFLIITVALTLVALLLAGCMPRNRVAPGPDGTRQNVEMRGMNNNGFNNNLNGRTGLSNTRNNNGRYTADPSGRVFGDRVNNNNTLLNSDGNNGINGINGRNSLNNGLNNRLNNTNLVPDNTESAANSSKRAEDIKSKLKEMPEVDDANCLVSGNTVVVGYKPSGKSKDVNTTKNKIIDMVKQIDKSANTVAVSESGDIMTKINNLTSRIQDKSISDIDQEIRQILQKINPVTR